MPLEKLRIAASTSSHPPKTIVVASRWLRDERSPRNARSASAIRPIRANGTSHPP